MNEKNLVICDSEFRYADSLGENIQKRDELAFRVYVCSSLEKVAQLARDKPIHIFVVDDMYNREERKSIQAHQTCVLAKGKVADLEEDECEIFKYQCADRIIRVIFEAYVEKTGENVTRNLCKERGRLVAVYSPIHRVGKTQFALALGKEYARGKRSLYLNLEEYAGFCDVACEGMNLGDLLYYIKQGSGNLGMHLQSAVRQMEELDYIWPIPMATDLKAVTADEWKQLISEILQYSVYEIIVLDIGESVQGLFEILSMCDRVYMPILEDDISDRKIRQYERNLEQLKLEKLTRITHRFVMPDNIGEYAKTRIKEEM